MEFTTTERNFFRSDACRADDNGVLVKQKPVSAPGLSGVHSNESVCFDCNICLDTAQDPVVTLCGHLFCWPCIYRWLHVRTSAFSDDHSQNCPVCKANIFISSLVPLYGRGLCSSEFRHKKQNPENMFIPRRPNSSGLNNLITSASTLNQSSDHRPLQTQSSTSHHRHYIPRHYDGFTTMGSTDLANAVMTNFLYPVIGMFGDMVCTRIFGTYTNSFTHTHQNTYSIGGNNLRMRRQEMQLEKSLNRVSIFFLCCIVLCLLLF